MKIAVTGATGFIGRYVVDRLVAAGHRVRAWHRPSSDRRGLPEGIEWVAGGLGDPAACRELVAGCEAVVHSALSRPGRGFLGAEGNVVEFARTNVLGTLELIDAATKAGVGRFVFVSTCAVHDEILEDRPLDEAHPLWARSHYGAHKAAIEKFVHSYGLGEGFPICAIRPTGVYGVAHPPEESKWFDLVQRVVRGETVDCTRGGKEVHAADVARGIDVLLQADAATITGRAYACYDRYVSQWDVAQLAREIGGGEAEITGGPTQPKHEIETGRIEALGMQFGGDALLRETIARLVEAARVP